MVTKVDQAKVERDSMAHEIRRVKAWVEFNLGPGATTSPSVYAVQKKLAQVEAAYKHFRSAQRLIELAHPEEVGCELCVTAENEYYDASCPLEAKLSTFADAQPKSKPAQPPPNPAPMSMPTVKIEVFDGDPTKWLSFYSRFKSMVHEQNYHFTYKFDILRQSLDGEAARQIKDLETTESNYNKALEMLYNRWHSPKMLVFAHLDKIFSFPTLTEENADKLIDLVDTVRGNLRALESLGRAVAGYEDVISYWILKKLDLQTKRKTEEACDLQAIPGVEALLKYVEGCAQVLRLTPDDTPAERKNHDPPKALKKKGRSFNTVTPGGKGRSEGFPKRSKEAHPGGSKDSGACAFCNKTGHSIAGCKDFKELSVSERRKRVKSLGLCYNCMSSTHRVDSCQSSFCRRCQGVHHTLLCPTGLDSVDGTGFNAHHALTRPRGNCYKLLPTAVVLVRDSKGDWVPARALLDTCSQFTMITERLRQRLGLKRHNVKFSVHTSGGSYESKWTTDVQVKSRLNAFSVDLQDALVLRRITDFMPSHRLRADFKIPKNLQLADPDFYVPGKIDLLLNVEVTAQMNSIGNISLGEGMPYLQNTVFGWTVSGRVAEDSMSEGICQMTYDQSPPEAPNPPPDEFDMEKFWRIEGFDEENDDQLTPAELRCDNLFVEKVSKTDEGFYEVPLPFKEGTQELGDSRNMAMRRLKSIMRRLERDPQLKQLYIAFINEYLALGHMEEVPPSEVHKMRYFIPHHPILRPESTTTKLRVVFDASAKTTNGLSFNDLLEKGPQLQRDLFSIWVRVRTHKFVVFSDVEKMFRQIRISDGDSFWHGILWDGKVYRLKTVTYGTRPAPYLAIRTLRKCAEDQALNFPLAAKATQEDFYMDDLVSGADDEETLAQLQTEMTEMFSTCRMRLRKWVTNSKRVFEQIPPEDRADCLLLDDDECVKTLGLIYYPRNDVFAVKINVDTLRQVTKRTIQSDIARMFDPLGLLAPVVAAAKIVLQDLWLLHLDWDEAPPQTLYTTYSEIRQQLPLLHDFRFPRGLKPGFQGATYELHGFADASEKAYAAVLYLRTVDKDGGSECRLICSKSRVAPLDRLTVARLELCAAELLIKLMNRVSKNLGLGTVEKHYWTDSSTVLRWLRKESRILQTFVANRVARIQRSSSVSSWHYVSTGKNPADLPSRGLTAEEFLRPEKLALWLHGPDFLKLPPENWPNLPWEHGDDDEEDLPEVKKKFKRTSGFSAVTIKGLPDEIGSINPRFHHSFSSVVRIFGGVLRFVARCRERRAQRKNGMDLAPLSISTEKPQLNLTPVERQLALRAIVYNIQRSSMAFEIQCVKEELPLKGPLRFLRTFVHEKDDLLRVGGRLGKGNYPFVTKHPVVLPPSHFFTRTLMRHFHYRFFHCGQQALLGAVRQEYWPINAKRLANSVIHNCNICFLHRPKMTAPIMGHLPVEALVPGIRPFLNVALDFAAGFMVHFPGRGNRPVKAYACIFVCLATHAVHIELTIELSTPAFIACLRRFISRRGLCHKIFSDNGTNFVGASNELQRWLRQLQGQQHDINDELWEDMVEFHFSPPGSPHFNGLAEAGVRRLKHHLRRIAGEAHLTYEELNTLFIMVEAIMNSRPLMTLSEDPSDLEILTPAHFLIGGPLKSFPEPVDDSAWGLRTRYTRLRQLFQHLWRRWSREFITSRQQLAKWHQKNQNLAIGDLVMILQDNTRPFTWPVGRVTAVHPGPDGVIRVADVRTRLGTVRRAVHRLCLLPSQPRQAAEATHIPQQTIASLLALLKHPGKL